MKTKIESMMGQVATKVIVETECMMAYGYCTTLEKAESIQKQLELAHGYSATDLTLERLMRAQLTDLTVIRKGEQK